MDKINEERLDRLDERLNKIQVKADELTKKVNLIERKLTRKTDLENGIAGI